MFGIIKNIGGESMLNKTLFYSLDHHKVISIIYIKDQEITQRKIQVLKIQGDKIMALDLDKHSIRTFKRDRILSAIDNKMLPKQPNFHNEIKVKRVNL